MNAIVVLLILVGIIVVVAARAGRTRARPGFDTVRRAKRVALVLMVGALVLLLLGFTQLRSLRQDEPAGTVMLVLDDSDSMSREDVDPTRLRAAKDAVGAFLDGLPPDLTVGLVVVANQAQTRVEPTTDRDEVLNGLVDLPRGEGTVVGDALATALHSIQDRRRAVGEAPSAIVALFDSPDTGSIVPPQLAAMQAAEAEVQVHTVLLDGDLSGEEAAAEIDRLTQISETTGGSAFTATTADALIDVYETLRGRLSTELAITNFGAWFIVAAAVLAVVATAAVLIALRFESR